MRSLTSTGTGVNMEPEVAPGTPRGTNTYAFIVTRPLTRVVSRVR